LGRLSVNQRPYTVVLIVPTGIGAAIGVMQEMHCQLQSDRLLADRLITHPNVLNGAQLAWPLPNATVSTSLQHRGGGCAQSIKTG